jgi:class 3 adenylate cyclase
MPYHPARAWQRGSRTGDGLLVEFTSVVDALRCAAEMQAALAEANTTIPQDRRVEFRIGIQGTKPGQVTETAP